MKAAFRDALNGHHRSLKVFVFEDKQFPAAWHFHPQYELTYIKSSSGIRYVGDSIQNFSPGDFVLVGANLPHSWKTFGNQTAPVVSVIAQFDRDMLGNGWLEKPEFSEIAHLLSLAARGIRFTTDVGFQLEARLFSLPGLPPFEKLMGLLEILHRLAVQNDCMLLSSPDYGTVVTNEDTERMGIIHNYVKKHVGSRITVAEVASQIGLTEVSFCRYFKKVNNKPFIAFLNEFRIALTCKQLIETDHTVSEIGYECGFNSISLLHRLFTRHLKMTPLEYRKSFRNIPVI